MDRAIIREQYNKAFGMSVVKETIPESQNASQKAFVALDMEKLYADEVAEEIKTGKISITEGLKKIGVHDRKATKDQSDAKLATKTLIFPGVISIPVPQQAELKEQFDKIFTKPALENAQKVNELLSKVDVPTQRKANKVKSEKLTLDEMIAQLGADYTPGKPLIVKDGFIEYIVDYAAPHCRSVRKMVSSFKKHFSDIENIQLPNLSRGEVRQWHLRLSREISIHTANRQLALLKAVYNFLLSYEMYEGKNPAMGVRKFHEEPRTRYFSVEEVHAIEAALPKLSEVFADYVRLSLATGQRQHNVLSMKWCDIDWYNQTWTIPRTKNGNSHIVSLIPAAIAVLERRKGSARQECPYVFDTRRKDSKHYIWPIESWNRLRELTDIKDIRPHDIRRTLGSWQASTGASVPVIASTLGHKSWASTMIYARLNLKPVKDAMIKAYAAMHGESF